MRGAGLAIFAAAILGANLAAPAAARRHRLHVPPTSLPRSLAVDEKEWQVQPSETQIAAGTIQFHAYNRGQDSHNFVIENAAGQIYGYVPLRPGASATVVANLPPGTYKLFCSLYAGTPESHDLLGMHAYITVR